LNHVGVCLHYQTSDIINPGICGTSFLEQVKQRFPKIPTLVITECRDIHGSLLKPFEREQLVEAVRRYNF
jgi:DNA-binding NtrC family response regulator